MNQIAQDYINKSDDSAQKALFERLHNLIMKLYPLAENNLSYGLLKYFIGKQRIWLGYWKQGVSLYTGCPELITAFRQKYPEIKTGKGCLNFRLADKIPVPDLKQLIQGALGKAGQ
jgi:uncharacterized protein YdhG (YjbR/CyaY superfamily)